jgi:RNA polymerase sigma-70 factor (ECF subfamily)
VDELYARYRGLVWKIASAQLGFDAAEDVVQEVFLALWKNAGNYDPSVASVDAFVTTVARRRTIDAGRRRAKFGQPEALSEVLGVPDGSGQLQRVDERDSAQRVMEILSEFSNPQRQVLRMALVDGLTHSEISTAIALAPGTVKSHVRRGLERLRSRLGESGAARSRAVSGGDGPTQNESR